MPEIYFIIIDSTSVFSCLHVLKRDKYRSSHGIPPLMVIPIAAEISRTLSSIFKKTSDTENLPSQWRTAMATPFNKGEAKLDPNKPHLH